MVEGGARALARTVAQGGPEWVRLSYVRANIPRSGCHPQAEPCTGAGRPYSSVKVSVTPSRPSATLLVSALPSCRTVTM